MNFQKFQREVHPMLKCRAVALREGDESACSTIRSLRIIVGFLFLKVDGVGGWLARATGHTIPDIYTSKFDAVSHLYCFLPVYRYVVVFNVFVRVGNCSLDAFAHVVSCR